MSLTQLVEWVKSVPSGLPEEMRPMAESICEAFQSTAKRLMDLGLGYLTMDRSASTLSTGERQRMQLARAVRNRTTGVLYVLDEPSIGLHPSNIVGLTGVMHDLVADGNSVILVDHDTQILKEADWIVEMGPEAGAKGRLCHRTGGDPNRGQLRLSNLPERQRPRSVLKKRSGTTFFPLPGTPHRRDRRVRFGKTTMVLLYPRAGGATIAMPAHIRTSPTASRMKLIIDARIGINRRSRPMRARMTSCDYASLTRNRPISPGQYGSCVAPAATAPASSVWTCSSCRMWTFPVRTAMAHAMPERPTRSA